MKHLVFLILFPISFSFVFSQSPEGDCKNALVVSQDQIVISKVEGHGQVLEISGNQLGNDMYFTDEHNTVWLSFKIPFDAELSFHIVPAVAKDDWDFMLFKAELAQCPEIANKTLKPLRGNLARNDDKNAGVTGLSELAQNEFSPAGVHPNMSKPVNALAKDNFILAVDINEANHNGFKLELHYKKEPEIALQEVRPKEASSFEFVDMTEPEPSLEKVKINFEVMMEGTNKPVTCNAEIVGVSWSDDQLKFENKSSFSAEIPIEQWFFVNVKKEGHTFGTEKFKATADLAGSTQKIYINEIKEGNSIVLKEIVFRENTTHLLPSSINALEQLIAFMNEYPTARIEIRGHVNAPEYDNDGKVKKFSLKRAEQIKEYLVDAGIDGKRIEVTGMGNEFMIYPNPKNYEEEKANRRVEIQILSF